MPVVTRDFTATTFIVRHHQTLLLWHRKIQAWLPPGGHIYPNELPETAAKREVMEETGFEVELLGDHRQWGKVQVLCPPACILLEDIEPGHQHIDLVYFASITGGRLRLNLQEAEDCAWYDARRLTTGDLAADIRILGLQAINEIMAAYPEG
jgi:8-oxo-dGTP pyrophosphatase MutT (NUDIX family)